MAISIVYCGTCNYRPIAASLAMAIKAATGLPSELVHSRESGAFEVTFDREIIFSKKATGHFPDKDTIVTAIRNRLSSPP